MLRGCEGLLLRVAGDGKAWSMLLTTGAGARGWCSCSLLNYLHLSFVSEPVLLRRLVNGRAWLWGAGHRCRRLGVSVQAARVFAGLCR